MIDLEKEEKSFKAYMNLDECDEDDISTAECNGWVARAIFENKEIERLKANHGSIIGKLHFTEKKLSSIQRELEFATKTINNLLEKLEAKHKAYIFLDDCRKEWHRSFMRKCEENKELKAKLAKYESDDVVVMPRIPTKEILDALESGIYWDYADTTFDPIKSYKAMIEAGEIK